MFYFMEHKYQKGKQIMKTIRKGFALLLKTILIALLVAMLTPIPYFAWRMGKPLPQPEFKGLSYYQYFEWRKMATEDAIAKYIVSHPNYEYKGIGNPMTACYSGDVLGAYLLLPPQAFSFTLAALAGKMPDELHSLPTGVTLLNFMPKWWDTFEYLLWYNQIHLDSFGSLVAECRIQPNIPTPEEFETMKLEHQLSAIQ
jgi:hypothetical protein